eukprot:jgi/Undpi1/11601/HiC_scaffold_30.g13896.m1
MDAQLTKAGVSDSWSFKGAVDAEPLLDVGDSAGTTPQAAAARSAPGHRQYCSSLGDAINTGPPIDTKHSVRNVHVNETSVTVKPTGNRNALMKGTSRQSSTGPRSTTEPSNARTTPIGGGNSQSSPTAPSYAQGTSTASRNGSRPASTSASTVTSPRAKLRGEAIRIEGRSGLRWGPNRLLKSLSSASKKDLADAPSGRASWRYYNDDAPEWEYTPTGITPVRKTPASI